MSDGFMADPIRPGDMNSSNTPNNNYGARNGSSGGKIALLIVFLVFVLPLIFMFIFFVRIWDDVGDDIMSQIKEEVNSSDFGTGYELSDDQQMAVARIFSTGILYENGGPKTIAQSDCRHLKNAVMAYYNYTMTDAEWYDNTYCAAGTINLATYFVDETEEKLGGQYARIDISSEGETQYCMNIAFSHNFRRLVAAKKLGHCNASKVEIKADDVIVPEIEPQNKAESNPEEDTDSTPGEGTRNVLRS